MELKYILLIACILIVLLYIIVFCSRTKLGKRKSKTKKRLTLILIRNIIIISIILFAVSFGILYIDKLFNSSTEPEIKETKTKETTAKETTTKETTTSTTTTKRIVEDGYDSLKYKKVDYISGDRVSKGTTSKGYKLEEVGGITYVDGYMIVNKTYGLPESYKPANTVEYNIGSDVKEYLNDMLNAASKAGYNMWGQSGYRSYSTQTALYDRYVARDGKAEADKYSARAGFSEHQTGYAIDICASNKACISSGFNGTSEANWLEKNCWKYGFILRYVKGKEDEHGYMYESWHFRYVGFDLAEKLYNNGDWITMESYFGVTSEYQD